MKITAIIICRYNSSRLKGKHFKKIGDKSLIMHLIDSLLEIKFINEIYIATGPRNKNSIFQKKLSQYYPKIKFYFHKNEDKVLERICYLSKKINKNILTISGDCPIISKEFITKSFIKFKKKKFDFLISKKLLQHEGIFFSKNKIWSFANKLSIDHNEQEHHSLFFKNHFKQFKYGYFPYNNNDLHQGFRMSVDTQSDLDFFNLISKICNKKNLKFNYENLIAYKKYQIINKHVSQKKIDFKILKKIYILTTKNSIFGYGHYNRSLIINRELQEQLSVIPRFINIKNLQSINLNKERYQKLMDNDENIFIIDLPNSYLDLFTNIKTINPKIIIDSFSRNKKDISIIPSLRNNNGYIYQGKKFLILRRDLLFDYYLNKIYPQKKSIDYLFIMGSTFQISKKILQDLIKLCKNYKVAMIVGIFVKKQQIKHLQKIKNLQLYYNPKNYNKIILSSNKIISRFGTSTIEVLSMKKKPWVYKFNESKNRKKDIKYLINQNLAYNYNFNELSSSTKSNNINNTLNTNFGGKNVISVIKHHYNK